MKAVARAAAAYGRQLKTGNNGFMNEGRLNVTLLSKSVHVLVAFFPRIHTPLANGIPLGLIVVHFFYFLSLATMVVFPTKSIVNLQHGFVKDLGGCFHFRILGLDLCCCCRDRMIVASIFILCT